MQIPNLHQMSLQVCDGIRPMTPEVLWLQYEMSPMEKHLFPNWCAVLGGCGTFKKWILDGKSGSPRVDF